jgi:hypothetical protein
MVEQGRTTTEWMLLRQGVAHICRYWQMSRAGVPEGDPGHAAFVAYMERAAGVVTRLQDRDSAVEALSKASQPQQLVLVEACVSAQEHWHLYRRWHRIGSEVEQAKSTLRNIGDVQRAIPGHLLIYNTFARAFAALGLLAGVIKQHARDAEVTEAFEPRQQTADSARSAAIGIIKEHAERIYGKPGAAEIATLAEAALDLKPGSVTRNTVRKAPTPRELAAERKLHIEVQN